MGEWKTTVAGTSRNKNSMSGSKKKNKSRHYFKSVQLLLEARKTLSNTTSHVQIMPYKSLHSDRNVKMPTYH